MQDIAKSHGGECLSPAYIASDVKLKFKCKEGHIWDAVPDNIIQNHWCPKCNKPEKLDIQQMKELAILSEGECLSEVYTNNSTKLLWRCNKKHEWYATPAKIKSGQWCPLCLGKYPTVTNMKDLAKSRGGLCLSEEYVNSQTKLKWQCSKKHIWTATPAHIKFGQWCPECNKPKKLTLDEIKNLAIKKDGICLSNNYVNNHTKMKFRCTEGHEWLATAADINQGNWCRKCSYKIIADKKRKVNLDEVRKTIAPRGFECLSDKINSVDDVLKFRCKFGHEWKTKYYHVKVGHGCPICSRVKKKY